MLCAASAYGSKCGECNLHSNRREWNALYSGNVTDQGMMLTIESCILQMGENLLEWREKGDKRDKGDKSDDMKKCI